jgi:hypothetical protein
MNRSIALTLGALIVVIALATNSTAAFAATKQRVDTLDGLSRELAARATEKARSLKGGGGTPQAGPDDDEMDATCGGDWFITWDEDANGNPIMGTFHLHCGGKDYQIG